jgi:hypothetical protein
MTLRSFCRQLFCLQLLLLAYVTATAIEVTVNERGVTLVDGKPLFPLGFYSVSWNLSNETLVDQISTIGRAGYNIVQLSVSRSDLEGVYRTAAENNVYIISHPSSWIDKRAFVDRFRNSPAFFGLGIADDLHPGTMTGIPRNKDEVELVYNELKRLDPNLITYVSVGGPNAGQMYSTYNTARRADLLAGQIYPVNGGSPINLVGSVASQIVAAASKYKQSPYINLQTFNWATNPTQRLPTNEETYNMTYQAIVSGIKGIIYYTFYDGGTNLPVKTPEYWKYLGTLVPEIKTISPYLLNGQWKKTDFGNGLQGATWEYNNRVLAIVVHAGNYRTHLNPSQNPADRRAVSLSLPVGTIGPAQRLFAKPSSGGLAYDKGMLKGELNLLEAQVYLLDKAGNSATPQPTPTGDKTFGLSLNRGWNLISFPLSPQQPMMENLFAGIIREIDSIYTYDSHTGRYLSFIPGVSTDIHRIEAGRGYFVYMKDSAKLSIRGTTPSPAILLNEGWNLIGYNSNSSKSKDATLKSIEDAILSVYTYDTLVRDYVVPSVFEPGLGYWIYATKPVQWSLTGTPSVV